MQMLKAKRGIQGLIASGLINATAVGASLRRPVAGHLISNIAAETGPRAETLCGVMVSA
jgi:hypothetical protein